MKLAQKYLEDKEEYCQGAVFGNSCYFPTDVEKAIEIAYLEGKLEIARMFEPPNKPNYLEEEILEEIKALTNE